MVCSCIGQRGRTLDLLSVRTVRAARYSSKHPAHSRMLASRWPAGYNTFVLLMLERLACPALSTAPCGLVVMCVL